MEKEAAEEMLVRAESEFCRLSAECARIAAELGRPRPFRAGGRGSGRTHRMMEQAVRVAGATGRKVLVILPDTTLVPYCREIAHRVNPDDGVLASIVFATLDEVEGDKYRCVHFAAVYTDHSTEERRQARWESLRASMVRP